MKKTGAVFLALAIAASAYMVDVRLNGNGTATIEVAAEADAFVRRIGRAFRRVGRAIKRGVRKIGKGIKKAVKKVGKGIKKVVKKVGKAVKKVVKKIGKFFGNIKNFAKNLKNKLIAKMKGFAKKIFNKVKGLFEGIMNKILAKVSDKLGFNLLELEKIIDKKSGKVNMAAVKKIIIGKVQGFIMPWITDKVEWLVNKGLSFIKPLLDGAASAIIGAVGSIPFAGGALAAAISVAYRFGLDALINLAIKGITGLVQKFVSSMLNKGFDFLARKVRPLKNFLDRVIKNAMKLYGYWKKADKYLNKK